MLFIQSVRNELLDEQENENVLYLESLISCTDGKSRVSSHYSKRKSDGNGVLCFINTQCTMTLF